METRKMFCYQCEQTKGGCGCTVHGVCGKSPETAAAQDLLTSELVQLAMSLKASGVPPDEPASKLIREGLFTCVTNVSYDTSAILAKADEAREMRESAAGSDLRTKFSLSDLRNEPQDIRSLKSLMLFGLRGMAAYACHAAALGEHDFAVDSFFIEGLALLAENHGTEHLLSELKRFGRANYRCMRMLDLANTSAFGNPAPVKVSRVIEPGPFIVVTGHDLKDLKDLLEATDGTGVNIYTHGEMLPAHGYPELRAHPQLRGNIGSAWQNQQHEFDNLPAPILWTTNCLMMPRPSYADKVWTTSVVGYPRVHRIEERDGHKDFGPIIAAAKEAGGWPDARTFYGINGGASLTTGCGRAAAFAMIPKIVELVRKGRITRRNCTDRKDRIRGFLLVGGCDGAKTSRGFFTEIVRNAPPDHVVLTLACGKFRFNDLDLGDIEGIPRLMDFGQCNDAYGAIQFALALGDEFGCGVNELPLQIYLSWYEQKAVAVLLTMLSLGIHDIRLGPSAPAFVSPGILKLISDSHGLKMI